MPIPPEISKLVERFDSQREAYQSGKYKEVLHRQTCPAKPRRSGISANDREIDRLVFELYGLTEEEIKIVEEKKYIKIDVDIKWNSL